jgi:Cof subfamily protein (haloacid dehalogenase superfamily)
VKLALLSVLPSVKPASSKMTPNAFSSIKLVASDLDGTLLVHSDVTAQAGGAPTKRALDVLHKLAEQGVRVLLASGRPPRTMQCAVDQMGLENILTICCNGGIVYDSFSKTIAKKYSIPTQHVKLIIKTLLQDLGPSVCLGAESGLHFVCDKNYEVNRQDFLDHHYIIRDPTEFIKDEEDTIEKLVVIQPGVMAETLNQRLHELFGGDEWKDIVNITFSNPHSIEISAAGVSKGSALKDVCKELGYEPAHVIAFGDMPNDSEMLIWAGQLTFLFCICSYMPVL